MWIFGRKKNRSDPAGDAKDYIDELRRQTEEIRARTAQMAAEREARDTPPDNADQIRKAAIELTDLTDEILEQMGLGPLSNDKPDTTDNKWSMELFTYVLNVGSAAHTLGMLRENSNANQYVSGHMQIFFVQTIAETSELLLPAVMAQKSERHEKAFIDAVTEAVNHTRPKEGARLRTRLVAALNKMAVNR